MSDKPLPGADAMTRAMEAFRSSAEDFGKLLADMRLPGMPDGRALMEAHKRNIEALTQANRVAVEGVQEVARRNMQVLQQTMSEVAETLHGLTAAGVPQAKAQNQADILKRAYDRAVEHARELAELIQKTNSEAASVLNRRFTDAMEEVQGLIAQAKSAADT